VKEVDLYGVPKEPAKTADLDGLAVTLPGQEQSATISNGDAVGQLQAKRFTANVVAEEVAEKAEWTFTVRFADLKDFRTTVEDILVLCHYSVSEITVERQTGGLVVFDTSALEDLFAFLTLNGPMP
jgi:hypothetical protein